MIININKVVKMEDEIIKKFGLNKYNLKYDYFGSVEDYISEIIDNKHNCGLPDILCPMLSSYCDKFDLTEGDLSGYEINTLNQYFLISFPVSFFQNFDCYNINREDLKKDMERVYL